MKKPSMNRRRFLGGVGGALIALPVMPSLMARSVFAQPAPSDPRRFAALFFPNGTDSGAEWDVSGQGHNNFRGGDALANLEPLKAHFSAITGLRNFEVTGAPPAHARGTASFLTGVQINNQDVARVGISADQIIATSVGGDTAFPSLELGPALYPGGNPVDTGWPSAYNCNLSWSSDEIFNSPEQSPRAVFDRLFGGTLNDRAEAQARRRRKHSILDYVRGQTNQMKTKANPSDRRKLDQYLTAIREVERRVDQPAPDALACNVEGVPAEGVLSHAAHTRAMMDLLVLAFQCDMTRVCTYMMDFGFGNKDFSFLFGGFRQLHHNITHSGGQQARLQHQQITGWYCDQFAYLIERMNDVQEETGTLLDNSMILFGSGLGSGRGHSGSGMPLLLAGRGGGSLSPGQRFHAAGVRHKRLMLTLIQEMGVERDIFAGEREPLVGL